jgi:nitroreductase
MELHEAIYKRKSTRKYDMTPLGAAILEEISDFTNTLKPLYEGIKTRCEFTEPENVKKNMLTVSAPHYILISSEKKDGSLMNAGFMFQQMDLFIQSRGLGSCWLGSAKPVEMANNEFEFVIVLAFGKPQGSPYRELSGYKRKALSEISANADERLEPARLAPSGINSQPWYFRSDGNDIHAYCAKHGAIKARVYERMNKIDMGIALAHLYISNPHTFEFYEQPEPKTVKGHYYIGSIRI